VRRGKDFDNAAELYERSAFESFSESIRHTVEQPFPFTALAADGRSNAFGVSLFDFSTLRREYVYRASGEPAPDRKRSCRDAVDRVD